MSIQLIENKFQVVEELLSKMRTKLVSPLLIISIGKFAERSQVVELYGDNYQTIWNDFLSYYKRKNLEQAPYFRLDVVTEEKKITFQELQELIGSVKRNNYGDFNFRVNGRKKQSFLMEELVGNAILKPSKEHKVGRNLPELSIDDQNYRGYMKRKYGIRNAKTAQLSTAPLYLFKTEAFYFENDQVFPLIDYGNGNRVRSVSVLNLNQITDLVIEKGSDYLKRQLTETGQFIYGYFPCYDQRIEGYNSVRHFSSLYALAEAAGYTNDQQIKPLLEKSLQWGIQHLLSEVSGYLLVKEPLSSSVEYKLGAQATAILAIAKYSEVTGDSQFQPILRRLIVSVKDKFITKDNRTIHVLDSQLQIKETFRIVYYDGEILFALLRAYGIFKEANIMQICEDLMNQFIADGYQKYHDHWLSYATNELLIYQEKKEYYQFGLDNALGNINFIDKRDTAYPTMLELLVAASKMIEKLSSSELKTQIFQSSKEFNVVKDRINSVMRKRVQHEITTGFMFPEFAQFFKQPNTISYGFFARHDRFRMRIDDAEHFLSGLINYRLHEMRRYGSW